MFIVTSFSCVHSQVKDIDGNTYKTVKIGNQIWFAEDLKVTRFNNGDIIPDLTNDWTSMSIKALADENLTESYPALSYYDNDISLPPLYNGYVAIDNRNVCPTGYKVPSLRDINILVQFLGGLKSTGLNLKSKNDWIHGGNNLSGFNLSGRGFTYGSGEFGERYKTTILLSSQVEKYTWKTSGGDYELYGVSTLNVYSEQLYEGESSKPIETQFDQMIPQSSGTIRCIKE